MLAEWDGRFILLHHVIEISIELICFSYQFLTRPRNHQQCVRKRIFKQCTSCVFNAWKCSIRSFQWSDTFFLFHQYRLVRKITNLFALSTKRPPTRKKVLQDVIVTKARRMFASPMRPKRSWNGSPCVVDQVLWVSSQPHL